MADAVVAWQLAVPAGLGPVDQDPDAVREDACQLLSPGVVCDPPQPEVVDRPPPASTGAAGGGAGLAWLLLVAVAAVLIALIVRAIATRVRDRDVDDAEPDDGDELVPLGEALIDPENPPGDWRSRSQRHRDAGEYRDALRCEYRALVGDLARRNLLDEIPGRTTGEERAQLRRTAPTVTAAFGDAADLFDAVWYGTTAATAELVDRFDHREQEILAATSRARRPVDVG